MLSISSDWTSLDPFLKSDSGEFTSVFLLVDSNTAVHCSKLLIDRYPSLSAATLITIPAGELNKNIQSCSHVWEILGQKADRKSLLVNLGGGVLTDLGGFVAATFKRGISFINIPTTLLAMVDASVGGKTGIDFNGLKNEIGVFAFPKLTYINPVFLNTLSMREVISGYAEMLKHGLIHDRYYWDRLKVLNPQSILDSEWLHLINVSVRLKEEIVESDPYEAGLRKILNFGHTIGHAIESYRLAEHPETALLHGEAIAAGMILEAWLSKEACGLSEDAFNDIATYLLKLYPKAEFDDQAVLKLTQFDKKNAAGKVRFALIEDIGRAVYDIEVPKELILKAFAYYRTKL